MIMSAGEEFNTVLAPHHDHRLAGDHRGDVVARAIAAPG